MARRSQRLANVAYYERNRELEIARVRARQNGTTELLRELRGRPCADCGGTFDPHQMDFDHRDGTEKRFRLSSGGAMLRSTSTLLDEVAKCDVVCSNCHRIRTRARHESRNGGAPGVSPDLDRKREYWRDQARLLDRLRDRPCMDCGGRFPPCAMDFDHRDPTTKRAAVTRLIGRTGTARLLEEVAKCDIVCANCHRRRTFDRRQVRSERE